MPDPYTFEHEPPIVFHCLNSKCKVLIYITEEYEPCPHCSHRGIRLTKLDYETWDGLKKP